MSGDIWTSRKKTVETNKRKFRRSIKSIKKIIKEIINERENIKNDK